LISLLRTSYASKSRLSVFDLLSLLFIGELFHELLADELRLKDIGLYLAESIFYYI